MKIVKLIAVTAAALGFASCGSGSGSSADVTPPVVPTYQVPTSK